MPGWYAPFACVIGWVLVCPPTFILGTLAVSAHQPQPHCLLSPSVVPPGPYASVCFFSAVQPWFPECLFTVCLLSASPSFPISGLYLSAPLSSSLSFSPKSVVLALSLWYLSIVLSTLQPIQYMTTWMDEKLQEMVLEPEVGTGSAAFFPHSCFGDFAHPLAGVLLPSPLM